MPKMPSRATLEEISKSANISAVAYAYADISESASCAFSKTSC